MRSQTLKANSLNASRTSADHTPSSIRKRTIRVRLAATRGTTLSTASTSAAPSAYDTHPDTSKKTVRIGVPPNPQATRTRLLHPRHQIYRRDPHVLLHLASIAAPGILRLTAYSTTTRLLFSLQAPSVLQHPTTDILRSRLQRLSTLNQRKQVVQRVLSRLL